MMTQTELKTRIEERGAPTFENRGNYLFVEIAGLYSLKLILSTIQKISDNCQHDNLGKVLVDLRELEGDLSIIDRFEIGVEVARVIGPKIKVAAVARRSIINYMAETVAVNRGANLKVFSEMGKALNWLEEK
ncbi:MAG TPA: hypothetical protein VHM28_06050 [Anaerolineales bacterium]|jgi:hypothetical protein|nr:hypothetical protein [Anaerolineales bacterium]